MAFAEIFEQIGDGTGVLFTLANKPINFSSPPEIDPGVLLPRILHRTSRKREKELAFSEKENEEQGEAQDDVNPFARARREGNSEFSAGLPFLSGPFRQQSPDQFRAASVQFLGGTGCALAGTAFRT